MKWKINSIYSGLISSFLVLLGFTACEDSGRTEYGAPFADFQVSGKVASADEVKISVNNLRVVMIEDLDETQYPNIEGDTVFTNNEGYFEIKKERFFGLFKFKLKIQGLNSENNEIIQEKIEKVELKDSDFKGGSGWYKGKAVKDLGTIEMKFKEKTE